MKEIGDKVRFLPGQNSDLATDDVKERRKVTGTVIQIHEEHRWYRVAYPLNARCIGHECFKF